MKSTMRVFLPVLILLLVLTAATGCDLISKVFSTATPTATPTPTATKTPTHTATAASTSTQTVTPTATLTLTPTQTRTPTLLATRTSTQAKTRTPTSTRPRDTHITISNQLRADLDISLTGPATYAFFVPAGQSIKVDIISGTYTYYALAGGYAPIAGTKTWMAGSFTWDFYVK